MLVRIVNDSATPGRRHLVEWMSRWVRPNDPNGVALFNPSLSVDDAEGTARFDAVVFTPTFCTVIEVEQLTEALDGELTIPLNGAWTVDGEPVRLSGTDERTPLDQSRDRTYALQNWLADNELGQHSIRGLVLLMPSDHVRLRVTQQWNDPAFAVVLGDHEAAVRNYFATPTPKPTESLTVDDIADIFTALGYNDLLPTSAELAAQGFIGSVSSPGNGEAAAQVAPTGVVDYDPFSTDSETDRRFLRYSPWALYPHTPGERRLGQAVARITLTAGLIVGAAWIVWFVIELTAASLP